MNEPFANLPKAQSAENNKSAIWAKLVEWGLHQQHVFEIGSGTGQHGVYFCQQDSELVWQPSEREEQLPTLGEYYRVAQQLGIKNFRSPCRYEIGKSHISFDKVDFIYSANVLHIISRVQLRQLVEGLASGLQKEQMFVCYGPFKRDDEFTTESNRDFHLWLKAQGFGGITDIQDVVMLSQGKMQPIIIEDMPANNFLVVYQKQ